MEDKDALAEDFSETKSKWHAILIAFVFLIFFSVLFYFETTIGELGPLWTISSQKVINFFEKYYIYSWIIIAFSTVLLFFILNIFTRFIKKWKLYFQYLLLILALVPWYMFANQLVYHENRYADYAKAIISYIGYPLLITIKDFVALFIVFIVICLIFRLLKLLIKWKILKKKSK